MGTQFYGISEGATPTMFGDPSSGKFGCYFIKEGKVRLLYFFSPQCCNLA